MGIYNTKTEYLKDGVVRSAIRTEEFPDGTIRRIAFYPKEDKSWRQNPADTVLESPQYGSIFSPFTFKDKMDEGYIYGGQTISPETWKRINSEMDKMRESMLFPAFNRK